MPVSDEEKEKPVIVHIDLTCSFSEGFTYQENLLPKYHVRMGYEVHFITTTWAWDGSGGLVCVGEERYINKDGFEVIRIENDQEKPWNYRLKTHSKLERLIEEFSPSIIFLHCLQVRDSAVVAKYVKSHSECKLFVDNHADYSNSATNALSKYILHRIIWRHYAKLLEPVCEKFWGVLPARVAFLIENYGLPRDKCDLLVMGADDDEVERAADPKVRSVVRSNFGFSEDDFVIVTGGKIDKAKTQTFSLMDAVLSMGDDVKLLVFGPVDPSLKTEFDTRMKEGKIAYVPWANASESYDYFSAADAVCFPGRHSVYWEQAAAMGKPLIVKDWPGTHHVDCGGNALFLESANVGEIYNVLCRLSESPKELEEMREAAKDAAKGFLYSEIARKSILLESGE